MRRLEPVMQKVLANFAATVGVCHKSGEIVPISCAHRAAASDVVTAYCFGNSIENLSREDYNRPFQDAVRSLFDMSAWFLHLPWLSPFMDANPLYINAWLWRLVAAPNGISIALQLIFYL